MVRERKVLLRRIFPEAFLWTPSVTVTSSSLVQTYYDDAIETKHMKKGGEDGGSGLENALPLILDH